MKNEPIFQVKDIPLAVIDRIRPYIKSSIRKGCIGRYLFIDLNRLIAIEYEHPDFGHPIIERIEPTAENEIVGNYVEILTAIQQYKKELQDKEEADRKWKSEAPIRERQRQLELEEEARNREAYEKKRRDNIDNYYSDNYWNSDHIER